MKTLFSLVLLLFCVVYPGGQAQEIDKSVTTEEHTVGGDTNKRYFLIRHKLVPAETPKEYGLLVILPVGPGGAEFLPFCAKVIIAHGTPQDFIVAPLVAPV
ncbi:hypothetical protein FEM03_12410 [Phragmitibacter flavus]|uniref:Alpha/beta hydrolase n=1 Tax=Phragmitibacter flavus TaxID=2576071 RepID=A0A5R8KE03_9BACT|nr:hypothetical protein [Phragmitibacter flavus]TLD70521.1 hypothetical protein FEM03_12410 [Phragmitibacter flavus]